MGGGGGGGVRWWWWWRAVGGACLLSSSCVSLSILRFVQHTDCRRLPGAVAYTVTILESDLDFLMGLD